MKRLFAILILGLLALGIAGVPASHAEAEQARAAQCAPTADTAISDLDALAAPASYTERPASRAAPADGPQLACNSACARSCAQRFGGCRTRECRQQYGACVRGCGC